ncbi:ammonia-forming cytochrome c nitrite reductase subunit c552 [Effusibacillus lacus]|uniref:nitrite reductase (cytochrome; ammonia-forming) n=1 Tax=Effusibacillus lacus TaxID=1348429 RepID=A0A292YIG9_9BACL|nr:ammonia-forming cytochrome c nitrite reductase subunit c552 [Effusibacillus lacus]TCS66902.1 respiratory nitrite reductase (cytochrome; ammonia-forming) precursor [Effusibacillus lacus]GAX90857.1 nitrite reductase [Effusibacillus lacus]
MKHRKLFMTILTLVGGMALIVAGCSNSQQNAVPKIQTNIPDAEPDSKVWGKVFPLQYESYLKNNEATTETRYGGSKPVSKYLTQPLLPELFKGYGFALEYNEDRGHTYSVEDVTHIKRINDKSPSSCWNCKSSDNVKLWAAEGKDYFKVPFKQRLDQIKHPIGCANCHDAKTMDLKVTNPNFIDSAKRLNIDLSKATKQEMRTYVCAQCHNEYYFKPGTMEVTNPWDKGFNPDEMVTYYNEIQFSDWQHPDSKTKMIKAQHPEFEMFKSGTHGANGVSCADCHMPYERDKDKKKYSSHHWTSPLKNIEQSCRTCHRDKTADELKTRVEYTQVKVYETMIKAQEASNAAHKAVKAALEVPEADQNAIKQAQDLIRKAQFEWDFVAAENSMGFHNPSLALETLAKSIDNSRQAQLIAEKITKK